MVRTRIAPSPTGFPHLGLVYQAIFDYVFAHKYNGKFVLRIEDTDQSRLVEGAEDVIYTALEWVHLLPDEGPRQGGGFGSYRQSERLPLYKHYAEELIKNGYAYRCFCTKERLEQMRKKQEAAHMSPRYDRTCRALSEEKVQKNLAEHTPSVIRMKIPDEAITVHDEIVGDVVFESSQIDEQVLLKSDGFPTYHLAVVVDDHLMEITHVFRGTEWLPSAPKHILLYRYFDWPMPKFIHIPILLNSQGGGKLSKRLAHTSVDYYKNEGFLPEAVVNYLANIVWNHPEGKEIFPIMDFGQSMELEPFRIDIKATGVKFDLQKLLWINGMYIREVLTVEQLIKALYLFEPSLRKIEQTIFKQFVLLAKTRIKTLKEFKEMVMPFIQPSQSAGSIKNEVLVKMENDLNMVKIWDQKNLEEVILDRYIRAKHISFKDVYTALIGTDKGLPLVDTFFILGKEKTLALFHG